MAGGWCSCCLTTTRHGEVADTFIGLKTLSIPWRKSAQTSFGLLGLNKLIGFTPSLQFSQKRIRGYQPKSGTYHHFTVLDSVNRKRNLNFDEDHLCAKQKGCTKDHVVYDSDTHLFILLHTGRDTRFQLWTFNLRSKRKN